jgi:hypothetical protein
MAFIAFLHWAYTTIGLTSIYTLKILKLLNSASLVCHLKKLDLTKHCQFKPVECYLINERKSLVVKVSSFRDAAGFDHKNVKSVAYNELSKVWSYEKPECLATSCKSPYNSTVSPCQQD